MLGYPLVAIRAFIEATRDSGYKSTSSALAELIDNALEAGASCVDIAVGDVVGDQLKSVSVTDNGAGMTRPTMQLALQFGGSTRFNSRRSLGRYGMGLPNGSLKRAGVLNEGVCFIKRGLGNSGWTRGSCIPVRAFAPTQHPLFGPISCICFCS
jgi:hypothetical protein